MQKRIILTAGHGGGDSGAVGQGTTEANEVIDIVNRTVDLLRKDGQLEIVHVPNNLNFEQGIAWVNSNYKGINDGLSVEVHKNSAGVPAHGVETWFYGGDTDSQAYAQKIQEKLAPVLPDRGVKPDTSNRWGQLGWMRNVNTWSLLVEMGFVSNGGDPVGAEANQKYAEALANGILNVWGLSLKKGYVMDFEDAVDSYWTGEHRNYYEGEVTKEEVEGRVGKKPSVVGAAMRESPNWLTQNHYVKVLPRQFQELVERIQELEASPEHVQLEAIKQKAAELQAAIKKLTDKE